MVEDIEVEHLLHLALHPAGNLYWVAAPGHELVDLASGSRICCLQYFAHEPSLPMGQVVEPIHLRVDRRPDGSLQVSPPDVIVTLQRADGMLLQGQGNVYYEVGNTYHQAAEQRAEALLKEWLSKRQLKQYEKHGWFYVWGSHSGLRYRITRSASYGVQRPGRRYCFLPDNAGTLGDIMLAQKLALEHNEKAVLRVANVHYGCV